MARYSSSPEVSRLAAEAANELSDNPFFEAELSNPLEALEHYCRSHLAFQRLAYSQGIAAAAGTARYHDCVEVLLPLVEQLARDHEPEIRSVAVQQICGLGAALYKKDAERSLQDIETSLLVCAQQCALDDEEEVSQAAILGFEQLAQLLPAARATAASKRAVDRLEARGTDDGTLAAVRLLAHTVSCWTQVALQRHVPRYINRWANHRDFSVREAVATCMSLIVKAMPLSLCHQLLLPFFYQLCRDSNWRVRRACSLDLPRLAQALQQQQEQQQQQQEQQQQQQLSSSEESNSSSSSNHTLLIEGSCCQKASTCLRTIRMSAELGSLSSNNLMAMGGHTGNRSSSAVNVPLRSTAEIMTKHPMHSSLITDSLLHNSDSQPNLATPSSSQPQPTLLASTDAPNSDGEQQRQQQGSPDSSQQQQGQQEDEPDEASPCPLQRSAPLLHDCWCALRQCMELLSADSSHWVKVAAMAGLGPFMLLLPGCQVGQMLLGRFTSMAGSTVVIYEISVALSCAQHFGALAVRLGPERWADMRDARQALQLSRDPAVLCELVKCLPALIRALGPAITVQELLPSLAGLLQAHLAWIAGQLVAVMAELLELLPPSSQDMLLKVLEQLVSPSSDRSKAWRLRRDLALQLGRMAAAAGPEAITDSLWPAAMHLCCDPVAAVRTAAAGQVGPLLAALPASLLTQRPPDAVDADSSSRSDSGSGSSSSSSIRHSSRSSSRQSLDGSDNSGSCSGSEPGSPREVDAVRCHVEAGNCCNSSNSSKECSAGLQRQGSSEDDTAADEDSDASRDSNSGSSSSSSSEGFSIPAAPGAAVTAEHSSIAGATAAAGAGAMATYGVRFQAHTDDIDMAGTSAYGHSGLGNARHSLDLELELPSALAPAPILIPAAAPARAPAAASSLPIPASYSSHPALGRVISSSLGNTSTSLLAGDSGSSSGSRSSDSSSSESEEEEQLPSSKAGSEQQQQQQQQPGHQQAVQRPEQQQSVQPTEQPEDLQQQEAGQHGQPQSGFRPFDAYAAIYTAPPLSAAQQQSAAAAAVAVHPAMAPIGHPAMSRPLNASPLSATPQLVPSKPQPRGTPPVPRGALAAAAKAKSAGDLLKVEAAAARQAIKRRHSSNSMPGRVQPPPPVVSTSSLGSCTGGDYDPSLPEPSSAAPYQYITCLLNFFGCSRQHQQRQLFVPLVMGMLAACHDRLSCEQAGQLLDRLEVLAADDVPGVRYAVAAALHSLRLQAAAQLQQQLEGAGLCQQRSSEDMEVQGQAVPAAADEGVGGTADAEAAAQDEIDSYHRYVKQLAARSGSCSGGPAAAAAAAAAGAAPGAAAAASATARAAEQEQQQVDSRAAPVVAAVLTGSQGASEDVQCVGSPATFSKQQQPQLQQPSRECCGVCAAAGSGDAAPSLEWLVKLSCCQQLERLMGVVALTTGPV